MTGTDELFIEIVICLSLEVNRREPIYRSPEVQPLSQDSCHTLPPLLSPQLNVHSIFSSAPRQVNRDYLLGVTGGGRGA